MPTLLEVQRAMRQSLVDGADAAIAAMVLANGIPPAERLGIYRGNATAALVEALRLSYPAIEKLVGGPCFEGCARRFIAASPPESVWLYDYGAGFSALLAGLGELAHLSYLPDVARLEWAINGALHAPDHERLDAAALAALAAADPSRLRLVPHPAVRWLSVASPADAIWRAVLEDDDETLARIDPADGPHGLLVERGDAGLHVLRLPEASWRLMAALFAGATLEAALAAAGDGDATAVLADHFTSGRIVAARHDG